LPVKEKSLKKKTRWFTYFIFEAGDKTLVRKRIEKDIWQNLFEFYLVETNANPAWTKETVISFVENRFDINSFSAEYIVQAKPQQLTHQNIKGYFVSVRLNDVPRTLTTNGTWVEPNQMLALAFPAFINQNLHRIKMKPTLF
jgi:A/G-specific adenine glycosylase